MARGGLSWGRRAGKASERCLNVAVGLVGCAAAPSCCAYAWLWHICLNKQFTSVLLVACAGVVAVSFALWLRHGEVAQQEGWHLSRIRWHFFVICFQYEERLRCMVQQFRLTLFTRQTKAAPQTGMPWRLDVGVP